MRGSAHSASKLQQLFLTMQGLLCRCREGCNQTPTFNILITNKSSNVDVVQRVVLDPEQSASKTMDRGILLCSRSCVQVELNSIELVALPVKEEG